MSPASDRTAQGEHAVGEADEEAGGIIATLGLVHRRGARSASASGSARRRSSRCSEHDWREKVLHVFVAAGDPMSDFKSFEA